MQWHAVFVVPVLSARSSVNQYFGGFTRVVQGCNMQCCVAFRIIRVYFGT